MTKDGKAMSLHSFMRPLTKDGRLNAPLAALRHHVTGAIARGSATAIECTSVSEIELERWADDGGPVRD